MLTLPLPNFSPAKVYEAARDRFLDASYKKRLSDGQNDILTCSTDYVAKASSGDLHKIVANAAVPPHILAGDMSKLYTQGLLRKNSEARTYYEKLRLSSPFRVCPLCMHRPVRTLDHFLPKAEYAAYAVLPANLVPCCRDCNSEKDETAPQDRAATLIHPYFDNIDENEWLGCEINHHIGYCTATFFIKSDGVADDLRPRLISHMEVLDLYELYEIEAARELNEMAVAVTETFVAAGPDGVRNLCEKIANSRETLARNYWRAVLWRAAANDEKFRNLEWNAAA